MENDLIQGVIYLPENLFYNATAPGILLFLNKAKPKAQKDKLLLVNASQVFAKGDPKNYIPEDGIERIASTFLQWKEEEKFSRIADKTEIVKNDYNISPSRYIHTGEAEAYRPIAEIVAELDAIESEARATDKALRAILKKLGYNRQICQSCPAVFNVKGTSTGCCRNAPEPARSRGNSSRHHEPEERNGAGERGSERNAEANTFRRKSVSAYESRRR